MRASATLMLLIAACAGDAPPRAADAPLLAGAVSELGAADALAAGDVDGDGRDSVVLVTEGVAHWDGLSATLGGRVQAVARGDIDGDGREEILIATGMGRGARDAPARLHALDEQGASVLWEQVGERAQVTDLAVVDGRIWLAAFVDRWNVQAGWLEGGAVSSLGSVRMGMQQRPLPDGGVVIGRLYGEAARSDGDLRLRMATGERTLPSHRGVRALAVADLGGPAGPELLVGDGWHHKYGTEGDPRVSLYSGDGLSERRTIAWLDGDYAARAFEVLGEGHAARVLVTGARSVALLQRDGLGWALAPVGAVAETGNAVLVRDGGAVSVAISGTPARRIVLERAP
jgi:hypothetical protein